MSLATWLDFMFRGHPDLLLYFTMVVCPLSMNVLQVSLLHGRPTAPTFHTRSFWPFVLNAASPSSPWSPASLVQPAPVVHEP